MLRHEFAMLMMATAGMLREAKYRSTANWLMPMAPTGTRPISTQRKRSTG